MFVTDTPQLDTHTKKKEKEGGVWRGLDLYYSSKSYYGFKLQLMQNVYKVVTCYSL